MVADQLEIYDMLGVEPGQITITAVEVASWGAELIVNCKYEGGRPFQLLFDDCQSIQWDMHSSPGEQDAAEVMGLFLGEADHKEAGIIYTDLFEIAVRYGTFDLVKDW